MHTEPTQSSKGCNPQNAQAPARLQESIGFIFSQPIQDSQGKDGLGPEHKHLGGSP